MTRCETQDKLAEDKNGKPMTLNNLAQKASETKNFFGSAQSKSAETTGTMEDG